MNSDLIDPDWWAAWQLSGLTGQEVIDSVKAYFDALPTVADLEEALMIAAAKRGSRRWAPGS